VLSVAVPVKGRIAVTVPGPHIILGLRPVVSPSAVTGPQAARRDKPLQDRIELAKPIVRFTGITSRISNPSHPGDVKVPDVHMHMQTAPSVYPSSRKDRGKAEDAI